MTRSIPITVCYGHVFICAHELQSHSANHISRLLLIRFCSCSHSSCSFFRSSSSWSSLSLSGRKLVSTNGFFLINLFFLPSSTATFGCSSSSISSSNENESKADAFGFLLQAFFLSDGTGVLWLALARTSDRRDCRISRFLRKSSALTSPTVWRYHNHSSHVSWRY